VQVRASPKISSDSAADDDDDDRVYRRRRELALSGIRRPMKESQSIDEVNSILTEEKDTEEGEAETMYVRGKTKEFSWICLVSTDKENGARRLIQQAVDCAVEIML